MCRGYSTSVGGSVHDVFPKETQYVLKSPHTVEVKVPRDPGSYYLDNKGTGGSRTFSSDPIKSGDVLTHPTPTHTFETRGIDVWCLLGISYV